MKRRGPKKFWWTFFTVSFYIAREGRRNPTGAILGMLRLPMRRPVSFYMPLEAFYGSHHRSRSLPLRPLLRHGLRCCRRSAGVHRLDSQPRSSLMRARRRRDPEDHDPSGVHFALFAAALAIIIAIM